MGGEVRGGGGGGGGRRGCNREGNDLALGTEDGGLGVVDGAA